MPESGASRHGVPGIATSARTTRGGGGIAQRVLLATLALATIIGVVFAVLLLTIRDARRAEQGVQHSQEVLLAANGLELRVLDLETGQRGFLLTRQAQFLQPWQTARAAIPRQEAALLQLVKDDPAQAARVRAIISATRSYVNNYSIPLITAAERGDPSAKTIAPTAEGNARMSIIRNEFTQLLSAEHRTSQATDHARATAARRAYLGALVGVGAAIALLVLYAGYLTRAIVDPIRRAAAVTGRIASGDLAARLPEDGMGEIGTLQQSFNMMAGSLERGRDELAALADEQAALRRVATLVAEGAPPDDVLAAVAAGIAEVFPADHAFIARYDVGGAEVTTVGTWSRDGDSSPLPVHAGLGGRNVSTLVRETGRPARLNPDEEPSGPLSRYQRALGIRSTVGVPINVGGRLWGVVVAASTSDESMPPDTEAKLESFTGLVSTAIANGESQAALTESRARIVVTADETRRRFERDLHDGAQQRFVTAALRVRQAQAAVPPELPELAAELDEAVEELTRAIDQLRDFAQGVHPTILVQGGLPPALRNLARHAAVPVQLELQTNGRLPEPVEVAAYYVVSEALTNATKHGHASNVTVEVEARPDALLLTVRDDGVGGASFGRGSGLVGLKDRVEALGGRIVVDSEPDAGTALTVELPLRASAGAPA
jgi:signal transduction histidine kinase